MGSMEHPIFSLSTKPDHQTRPYKRRDIFVTVKPGAGGLATVHDRDVLIYCISQVIAGMEQQGRKPERVLHVNAIDLLIATNRPTAGSGYAGLRAALERLKGTVIETNITTGGIEELDGFSLIDRYQIVREHRDGRMLELKITLSDWVLNAITSREVLTLNRQYFQLRKPLERRLYELARKHCGRQKEWRIGLKALKEKTGSGSTPKEFKRLISKIVKDDETHNYMPDYTIRMMADIVIFEPRPEFLEGLKGGESKIPPLLGQVLHLSDRGRERAKEIAVRYGWDLAAIEQEWRNWMADKQPPEHADAAFVGFTEKWCTKRGYAR